MKAFPQVIPRPSLCRSGQRALQTWIRRQVRTNPDKHPRETAAKLRGEIDRGATGDKAPGLDPAAAPMETDAEAGGTPPSSREIEQALQDERRGIEGERHAVTPEITPDGGGHNGTTRHRSVAMWALAAILAATVIWAAVAA